MVIKNLMDILKHMVTEFEHVKRYWKVDFSTNKLEIG